MAPPGGGSTLVAQALAEVDGRGWRYDKELTSDQSKIQLYMNYGDGVNSKITLSLKESTKTVIVYVSYHGTNIPENRRAMVAELLTRVNMKLSVGHFEMDYRDGEVRYRVSVGFGKCVTYRPIIKDLLEYALQTPAKVFKQIERGVANNLSATAALNL